MDRGTTIAHGRTHDLGRRALRILAITALLCLLAEGGLRLFARPRLIGIGERLVDRDGLALLPPLATFTAKNERGEAVPIQTDALGLRNPPGALGSADLLVLGDFFIVADNTEEPRTLAGLLRRAGWKVCNAGMIGAGTARAGRLLEILLAGTKPRAVVLAFSTGRFFYEDYWSPAPGRDPGAASGPLARLRARGRSLCGRSALCRAAHGLVVGDWIRGRRRNPMGTVASAAIESFKTEPGPEMGEAVRRSDAALGAMAARLTAAGVRFVILGIPSRAQVGRSLAAVDGCFSDGRCPELSLALLSQPYSFDQPEQTLAALAKKHGIAYVSLLDAFREAGTHQAFCQVDDRWNAAGQALAAQALAAALGPPPRP